jgi:hypothetical protein
MRTCSEASGARVQPSQRKRLADLKEKKPPDLAASPIDHEDHGKVPGAFQFI